MSRYRVDRDYVRRLVVPRTVFPPVRSRDFLPGIVERLVIREDLHLARVLCAGLVDSCFAAKFMGQSRVDCGFPFR